MSHDLARQAVRDGASFVDVMKGDRRRGDSFLEVKPDCHRHLLMPCGEDDVSSGARTDQLESFIPNLGMVNHREQRVNVTQVAPFAPDTPYQIAPVRILQENMTALSSLERHGQPSTSG